MKNIFLTIVISLTCTKSFSQVIYSATSEDFNQSHYLISSAERMYQNDSALQAYAKFSDAFNSTNSGINPTHYFSAAMSALKIREEFKALTYFEKAIKNGLVVDSNKLKTISFQNVNTRKEFNTNYKTWTDARDANRNYTWESDLYQATVDAKKYQSSTYNSAIDYCVACLKNKACSKTTPDYKSKYKLVRDKQKADSAIAVKVLADITKYGKFPNLSVIDNESCNYARKLLLNYDADKNNTQLNPILFKAINDGFISPAFYAEVVDRRNVMDGLAPEFYEPITGYEKTISNVMPAANAKRKTIGLYNIMLPSKNKKPTVTNTKAAKGAKAPVSIETDNTIYNY